MDPVDFFLSLLASSNGRVGTDRGAELMDGLLMHMMSRSESTRKPSTKESVIAALPSIIYGPTTPLQPEKCQCTICLENFAPGEEITHLPCDHYFHLKSNATNECHGIVSWLRKSNECPLCRFALEGQYSSSSLDMSQPWVCPGCDTINSGDVLRGRNARCSCSVTRAVVLLVERSPYLEDVRTLCAAVCHDIFRYHQSRGSSSSESSTIGNGRNEQSHEEELVSSGATGVSESSNGTSASNGVSSLTRSGEATPTPTIPMILRLIRSIENSSSISSLEEQHWDVKAHLSALLMAILNRDATFPVVVLCPNSRAVLRSIHKYLAQLYPTQPFTFHTRPTSRPVPSQHAVEEVAGRDNVHEIDLGPGLRVTVTTTTTTRPRSTPTGDVSSGGGGGVDAVASVSSTPSSSGDVPGGNNRRRFPVLDHVKKFVMRNDIVLDELATAIVMKPSARYMQAVQSTIQHPLEQVIFDRYVCRAHLH